MRMLIIEDEPNAARRLQEQILELDPEALFEPVIDQVAGAVRYLMAEQAVDLVFMDIHLSDGLAFEVFESVPSRVPVIFTTAYDQYAIKAFEANSIDYLLKPVSKEKLARALAKYQRLFAAQAPVMPAVYLQQLKGLLATNKVYKENFLVPYQDKLLPVRVADFAWFEIRNGVVVGMLQEGRSLVLEQRSLDELTELIRPDLFYRANRQYLVNRNAIREVHHHFNGKMVARLHPAPSDAVVISREKVSHFKSWMEQ